MTQRTSGKIRVLCVDDNPLVTEALTVQLGNLPDIDCIGSASSADELLNRAASERPDVVLLDYDMPGKPAFEAIAELQDTSSETRVVMFSGYIRSELVDQAIDAGAWGYVAKYDPQEELLKAIRDVAAGSFAFSPTVRAIDGG